MKRRDALKAMLAFPASLLHAAPPKTRTRYFGAFPHNSSRPAFRQIFSPFNGISRGKRALLWKYMELATGSAIVPHSQRPHADGTPGEGDCVGHATGLGADILAACDIYMKYDRERWVAESSVEAIYWGSRVEIGQNAFRGPGSRGEWAAEYVKQYGILHRQTYQDGDNFINLEGYHPGRSRSRRHTGVPDWLEPFAKQHPIKTYTKVRSAREAFDAIYVGQPVVVCSSYAFEDTRDSMGFAKAHLGRWRTKWFHAMLIAGYDDTGSRPGGLICNSALDWNSGPTNYDQPIGSFWVDADIIDLMLGEWDDSHALSMYHGHSRKRLNHRFY